jgi:hypothetical protein
MPIRITSRIVVEFHRGVRRGSDGNLSGFTASDSELAGQKSAVQVSSAQYSKALGTAAATWNLTLKVKGNSNQQFFDALEDGDWCDFFVLKFDRLYHVDRGIVMSVRRAVSVGSSTTTTYSIQCAGFGKIFEITPLWYDLYTDGEVMGRLPMQVFSRMRAFLGAPDRTVQAILFNFFMDLEQHGRSIWSLPGSMNLGKYLNQIITTGFGYEFIEPSLGVTAAPPLSMGVGPLLVDLDSLQTDAGTSATTANRFIRRIKFVNEFNNLIIGRQNSVTFGTGLLNPYDQYIWPLAQAWSDAPLCEMFTDLTDEYGSQSLPDGKVGTMSVIFRDRPAPGVSVPESDATNWKHISSVQASHSELSGMEVGKSGDLRLNAFFAAPIIQQLLSGNFMALQRPIWDEEDVRQRGLRRMVVQSNYFTMTDGQEVSIVDMYDKYRKRLRDIHCMNHELLTGSADFAHPRPDIHVGMKLVFSGDVTGGRQRGRDEQYYVESVNHSWDYNSGVKTSVGLSRGWIGDDISLYKRLQEVVARYNDNPLPGIPPMGPQ